MGKITTNPGEKKPAAEPAAPAAVQLEPTAPLPQKVDATELPLPVTITTAAPPRRNRRCCITVLSVLIVLMVGVSITLGALYLRKHRGRDHDEHHWDGEDDGDWDELMSGGDKPHSGGDRPYPGHHRPGSGHHRPGGHSGEHRPGHDSSSSEEHGHWRPRPHRPYPPRPRPSDEPLP
ncbi:PREDICTED: uncharacterized protein LOC109471542 [Branchiostoma belcheri]|uniref:Uncharacterized protein LOC109471542 n=1 Tax=Branchiostoma belcheri TaxID=7741 RepID=A0A6P4YXH9_BRABE|nr:PREDICTED: uncharacterized protein LOC109471542 [Branchiostoma belcheri]